jgi:hypothetical protein
VLDPTVAAGKVPYAELATPEDKEAFKPSDVTLPERTVEADVVEPAPDKLQQVERATLVQFPKGEPATMPWHPAGQKPVPGFVEGSQNAILNPAAAISPVRRAELVDPDPDAQYLDPEVRRAAAVGQTPRSQPAVFPTVPKAPGTHTELAPPGQMDLRPDELPAEKPAVQPPPQQPAAAQPAVKPVADDWATWTTVDGTPAEVPATKPTTSTEPPINAPNGKPPVALIIHHTSGRGSAANVVEGWRTERPGVGSQYIMDRDGVIHETQKEFGYGGTGHFLHSVIPGVSNQTAVGIEVIARDDADMTPAQIESLKRFAGPGGPYANVSVYGHSQVSPGDRDNEGIRGVTAINEARKAGGAGSAGGDVLTQLESSGLHVTNFGAPDDPYLDKDSAKGKGKFVDQMVPGYDVALNDAAARLVGNPKPGEEFQYGGRTWRYGDQVPEKYSDARFDIFDPYKTAISSLGAGKGATAAAPKKQDWESWATLSPADEATITAAQADQFKILDSVNQNTPNKGAFWKILNSSVPGVSSNTLQAYRDQFKKQVTDYALEYYKPGNPDITPEQAFQKATGDADFGTLVGEMATKIVPNLTHAAIAMERGQDTIDENRINMFLDIINRNMSPEKRVEFKRELMAMNPMDRARQLGAMVASEPDTFSGYDVTALADSFDRISDPVYQAKRKAALDLAVAKNQHDLQTDPRLVNTPAEGVTQFLASAPKNIMEMLTPVIGHSAMLSEIYTDTADQLKKEHPDWSEDDIKAKATASTVAQIGPQVIIGVMTGWALSAVTKVITQPLMELGARLGLHSTVAGVAGGIQQIAKNATEGHPLMDGVQEAVIANAPYGLFGGAMAGRHPSEAKPIGSPVETGVIHGPEERIDTGFTHGPEIPPGVHRPVTVEQNVPEPSPLTATSLGTPERRYEAPPIVTRGKERTTFTPAELAEQAGTVTGRTPEELQAAAERLQPPMNFIQRSVFLNSDTAQQVEILRARAAQAPQEVHGPAPQGPAPEPRAAAPQPERFVPSSQWQEVPDWAAVPSGGEYKVNMATGKTEARWTGNIPGADKVVDKRKGKHLGATPPPRPGSATGAATQAHAGEAEPWMSKIANRFMAERVAKGEVGPVEPGHGETTEALVARGSRMSPEQVAQHASNLRHDVGGNPVDQAAAVRFEEARLSQRSHELSLIAERNPENKQARIDADEAFKYVTDFHNEVIAKLKNNWHKMGMTLQGDVPVDLANFNGLREEFFKNTGKMPQSQTEAVLRKSAKRVRDANAALEAAIQRRGKEIDQLAARRPLPTHEQVREAIAKRMKGEFPCPT